MEQEIKTPIKAIRAKCLDCCCGSATEVKLCPLKTCSLYPYRKEMTPEQKEAAAARLAKARAKKEAATASMQGHHCDSTSPF